MLRTSKPIQAMHNFYRPAEPSLTRAEVRRSLPVKNSDFLLIHMSNLRPVKRFRTCCG